MLYVCGTDEYGTATETKACAIHHQPYPHLAPGDRRGAHAAADLRQVFWFYVANWQRCSRVAAIHRDVYKWFDIAFDFFGRTTTPAQTQITQACACSRESPRNAGRRSSLTSSQTGSSKRRCASESWHPRSLAQTETQQYCPICQQFLADRFVEGTCYLCSACAAVLFTAYLPAEADGARGDQCETCDKVLDANQLINPKCK